MLSRVSRLEQSGKYTEALESMCARWREFDVELDTDGLDREQTAEYLLRAGSLIGRAGYNEGLPGAQERAKDLLMRAREIYLEIGNDHKVVESEFSLADAYCRMGEYREAHVWLDHADEYDISSECYESLSVTLFRSMTLMYEGRHEENVSLCSAQEARFREHGNPRLNGSLSNNMALSLKDLGRFTESLTYMNLARAFTQRARHQVYLGSVENNLAMLYKDRGEYELAHLSVDAAIAIYRKLRDKSRRGSSLDTKAQIYLAEGKFPLAEKTIDRSIALLRTTENFAYLAESLATKARIQLQRDNVADALLTLSEAVEITRRQSGERHAKQLSIEFERALTAKRDLPVKDAVPQGNAQLEIVVPPALASFTGYNAVRSDHSLLACIGIGDGSLVLVINELPRSGEPVAVMEKKSSEVTCGFFDEAFGIVSLEGKDGEPVLFDGAAVTVLGRIIGICRDDNSRTGRMIAEPVTITQDDLLSAS